MENLLLPIPYFHTVFTTDHRINDLAYHNPEVIYNLLFETSSRVLKQFGRKYLGGEIGFSGIIHSNGQTLQPHIHVHFMRMKLKVARLLVGVSAELPPPLKLDLGDWLNKIGASDALTCPFCGVGQLSLGREFAPLLGFRLWLLLLLGLPVLGKEET